MPRSRSRSRTWSPGPSGSYTRRRSRSRPRKHHKKKSYHRRRSRSTSIVHVNPLFVAGSSYNHPDEMQTLRNELYMAQTRAVALEADSARVRTEFLSVQEELNRMRILMSTSDHKLRDSQLKVTNIERTNNQLRAQVNAKNLEIEKGKEKLKYMEVDQAAQKERVVDLEKRNETIVKKCEELTFRCRQLQLEKDETVHNVSLVKQHLETAKETIEGKKKEVNQLLGQIKTLGEREQAVANEKHELEMKLKEKDLQSATERRRFSQEKKKDQETIANLKKDLKDSCKQLQVDEQCKIIMGTLLGIQEQQDMQIAEFKRRIASLEK